MFGRASPLRAYGKFSFAAGPYTRDVYKRGAGPGVIVIHEIPGLHPGVIRFADRIVEAGMTVYLPVLFGVPGKAVSNGYVVGSLVNALCVRREFNVWRAGQSSPIVDWLRALAKQAHAECGGRGVGAVGMCFTGGFALAMMTEPAVVAPVLSQPSMPVALGSANRAAGIDASPAEVQCARRRFEAEDLSMIALRFKSDKAVPDARFATYAREFGERFEPIELEDSDAAPSDRPPHSVLTIHLREDGPSKAAEQRVIAFLQERTAAPKPAAPRKAPHSGDPLDLGASALTAAIAAKEISCEELMRATLARIEKLNPRFNAIVALRDGDALLAEARAKDAALARGEAPGPLWGLPMAIKDLQAVEGFPLTKGSPLLSGNLSPADSVMVARLRAAGAIFIGKTNVPEFGLGSHTVNPVHGPTRNAYDESLSAGGSSGGAAAALALRMVALADGSDYAGSLRNPAGWNNIYGFRPSFGRVPNEAGEAWIPSMNVLGPMARDVDDLALLFSVQAGYDPRAPLSLEGDGAGFRGPFTGEIVPKRIAWVGDFGGAIPFARGVLELAREALKVFEGLGCLVEEARPDFDMGELWRAFTTLRQWQNAPLLEFYRDASKRALLPPQAIYEVENGLKLTAYDVSAAASVRTRWTEAVRRFSERYDFWALPTAQCFAFPVQTRWPTEIAGRSMATYHEWMQCVVPATMCGCPTIAAPAGFDSQGRAMGVQIVGRNHGERELLEFASAYDRATRWPERRPPGALAKG